MDINKRDPEEIRPRTLTKRERTAFWPRWRSQTHDEEIGFRRGFDQGVAAMAYALGIENDGLQRAQWKKRVRAFRDGHICECPFHADRDERVELCLLLPGSTPSTTPDEP